MRTILVVDDDSSIRGIMATVFKRAGHLVLEAGTAAAGMGLLAVARPDLVILDAALPDGDGLVLCRALRSDARTRGVPVVMVSGAIDPPQSEPGGPDAYLMKPFKVAELSSQVTRLLS